MFGFSRTETNGFLILLPLMIALIFSEPIYRFFIVQRTDDFSKQRRELDSLVATWEFQKKTGSISLVKSKFNFNPNTATEEDFISLGFPGNLTHRILNYRAKKGKFVIKADLKKIYGLDSSFYCELVPFIDLPEKKPLVASAEKPKAGETKKTEAALFDLNQADTTQLKKIYGIGPVLAQRIVTYRDKLGGFVSAQQLNEVYGLDTAVINQLHKKSFVPENFNPTPLNVNQADENTLANHPYIKFKLAKAIITYRFQHGNFKTIDDLTRLQTITPETLNKLRPYVSF